MTIMATTPRASEDAVPSNNKFPKEIRSALLEYDEVDNEIEKFVYDKLPTGRKRIRLLRLSPGVLNNPQVVCEMIEAEFNEHNQLIAVEQPHWQTNDATQGHYITRNDDERKDEDLVKYDALSWRWGDEDKGEYTIMIRKNGAGYREQLFKKKVSRTLGLALKYLRLPAKDRMIWIDAICINQEDREERSFQVSMMSLVYTSAEEVCVWLGEDDKESTRAITFIENEVSKLKNFDDLCKDRKHAENWGALLVLMQRDWFSRRWVVQEITLARKATVYCGPDSIKWRDLAIAVELFVEVETATHRLSELMKKDERFALVPYWFEHISELGASLLVNATARIFRDYQRGQDGLLTGLGRVAARRSLLSLEYLVTSLSIFDCGRPHDSIYALVAIARDAAPQPPTSITERTKEGIITSVFADQLEQKPYPLDYNSPYADVCKEFIQFCIGRAAKADSLQALDILCRPWAKEWRPEHQRIDDKNKSSKTPSAESGPQKQIMIKHEGEWFRMNKLINDWEKDTRSCQKYFEQAQGTTPIRPFITEWFPKRGFTNTLKKEQNKNEDVLGKRKSRRRKKNQNSVEMDESTLTLGDQLGLPSWVARITAAPFDIFLHPGMDMVKMGRKNADPLVGIPQDGHRNYSAGQSNEVDMKSLKFRKRARLGHYSLYVKGFCFDRVDEVAQVSQGGAIPATWLDMAGWSKARRFGSFDNDPGDPPDAFWRTLVADRGRYDRNPPYYYARACKETIMKGGLRSNAVNTTDLIYNERNSIIAEFCRRVQAVIWNRALIRTEKGLLGLVSEKVKEGDLICIIYGCTVPVILRKGKWKRKEERENEENEDLTELMKKLMANCEKARSRKAQYREGSKEWIEILKARKTGKEKTWTKDDWKAEVRRDLEAYKAKQKEERRKVLKESTKGLMIVPAVQDIKSPIDEKGQSLREYKIRFAERGNGDETVANVEIQERSNQMNGNHNMQGDVNENTKGHSESSDAQINQIDMKDAISRAPTLQADESNPIMIPSTSGPGPVVEQNNENLAGSTVIAPVSESKETNNRDEGAIAAHAITENRNGKLREENRGEQETDKNETYEDDYDDDLHEDESDEEGEEQEGKEKVSDGEGNEQESDVRKNPPSRQELANRRDPYRHYEFLGEAYIHGMMDGEAVREKFYKMKPDHMFELR
jgi:hypothetical protein